MSSLSRNSILDASDSTTESLHIPEWSGSVHVRTMTGAERDSFESDILAEQGQTMRNIRAKLAVRCLCDADGTRLFDDADAEAHRNGRGCWSTRCKNALGYFAISCP